jgi:hypothetical protein
MIILSERAPPRHILCGMFRVPLRPDLHAGDFGPFICVSTRVERVEQGRLRVTDYVDAWLCLSTVWLVALGDQVASKLGRPQSV